MAFAGDHEVVIAVQPQLDGPLEFVRGNGRPHSHMAGLGFLAAKTAAHAPALHTHGMVVQAQRMRHPVLHLARVLGAGVHQPLVLLLRHHVGYLAFEVKVFLPADFKLAAHAMRCTRQRAGRIAALDENRRQHIALRGQGVVHAEDGRQRLYVANHLACGPARLHDGVCHHHAYHLADVLDRMLRKNRFVVRKGSQHGVTGNVAGQDHIPHPRHGQCRAAVDAQQTAVCNAGENGRGIQRAPDLRDIVHIGGRARDLGTRAFMELRSAGGWLGAQHHFFVCVHRASSSLNDCRLICCMPWLSSQ